MKKLLSNKVLLVFIFFALIFCSISLVNHYNFRTFALDLGMFNHAVYSLSQFKMPIYTLDPSGIEMSFFATHFSLITLLYAPFYYIFGSYTLLLIQIFAILFGGLGIYKYAIHNFPNQRRLPLFILIHFFSIWGIYSALSFDFHNNVIGAMLVPWFVYHVEKRNFPYSCLYFLLILFSKEVEALWLSFILIGLMIKNYKSYRRSFLKFEIPLLATSLIYGIILIGFIMPYLQGAENNLQLIRYKYLGDSLGEIIITLLTEPWRFYDILFTNTVNDTAYNYIKIETYVMMFMAGGFALFFRPAFLVMLIPIFAQKFLANNPVFWGINGQYSIEFVPIISLALIAFITKLKKHQTPIILGLIAVSIGSTLITMKFRYSKWYDSINTQFYSRDHYAAIVDIKEVREALRIIDNDDIISTSSCLASHLANSDKIYHFPIVKDAKYIVLFKETIKPFPFSGEGYKKELERVKNSGKFNILVDNKDLLILKKS